MIRCERGAAGRAWISQAIEELGWRHAFWDGTTNSRSLRDQAFLSDALVRIGAEKLILTEQVHGTHIWEISDRTKAPGALTLLGPGDAILAPRLAGLAIGVETADCVPLIAATSDWIAVIHAGWRGLAAGIVEQAISRLRKNSDSDCYVAIGPCAGGPGYEVGTEVIQALGAAAIFSPGTRIDRLMLDLEATALGISQSTGAKAVTVSGTYTIGDKSLHSFRRDGKLAGRNLTWVAL